MMQWQCLYLIFLYRRASEFLRLLQLKVTASSGLRQFSDTSRVVMCLDLACNKLGYPFDKVSFVIEYLPVLLSSVCPNIVALKKIVAV